MTTYTDLGAIFATKQNAFEKLEKSLGGLSTAQALYKPSDGAWSLAGIAEHLAVVEGPLVQLITALVKRTEDAGKTKPAHSPIEVPVGTHLERSRTEKYVTRDKYAPIGKMTPQESMKALREVHGYLQALLPRLEVLDLSFASFPHWIFGPLTLGQWLAFVGLHEERHLKQIESIRALPEFPADAAKMNPREG